MATIKFPEIGYSELLWLNCSHRLPPSELFQIPAAVPTHKFSFSASTEKATWFFQFKFDAALTSNG